MKSVLKVLIVILVIELIFLLSINIITLKKGNLQDNFLISIAYIGGLEEDYNYNVANKYVKNNIENISLGGEEKYLIIPNNTKIGIYKVDLDIDANETETFIKYMNEPFYLTCNVSDIFPNSRLKIEKNGKVYEYSPHISLKDGSVSVDYFVKLLD